MDNIMATDMAPYCAISFQQLKEVDALVTNEEWTMRDVCREIIVPNQLPGKSYALSKNKKGLKLDAFVTHCWDEPFKEFCRSLKAVFRQSYKKPNLWICAFAIRQGDAKEIGRALEGDLDDSPFAKALQEAATFVVVRNRKKDLYTRAWCVCELLYAAQQENLNMFITGPDTFANAAVNCRKADASYESDRKRIMEKLREYGFDRIDRMVRKFQRFPSFSEPGHRSSPTSNSTETDTSTTELDDHEEDEEENEIGPLLPHQDPVPDIGKGETTIGRGENGICCALRPRAKRAPRPKLRRSARIVVVSLLVGSCISGGRLVISKQPPGPKDPGSELRGPCSAPSAPVKFWTNELYAIKELERNIGKMLQVFTGDCGDLPYPSSHMTLTASLHKRHAGEERCVVELSISGQGLSKLPESIPRMQCLMFLDLSQNNLTTVPDIFEYFPSLAYVDLRGNPLESLPPTLSRLKQQGTLLVDALPFILEERIHEEEKHAVQDIQGIIGQQLELAFEGHSTKAYDRPETNGYPMFAMAESKLDYAKTSMLVVRNHNGRVHDIVLREQNLTSLPDSVYELPGLAVLSLRNNSFTEFPDKFEGLPKLSTLDVFDNPGLRSLPLSLQKRIHSGDLRVAFNDPIGVPTDHLVIPNEAGAIRELEALIGRNITVKSEVTGNFGMTIDKGRVRDLALVGVSLTELPPSFGTFTDLVTLDLSRNKIAEIPDDLFWNFPYLHEVNLEGNPLKELPSTLTNNPSILLQI